MIDDWSVPYIKRYYFVIKFFLNSRNGYGFYHIQIYENEI